MVARKYLLASWGSGGDLVPFLGLGAELRRRGHHVTLLGNPDWRDRVEENGLRFVAGFSTPPALGHPELFSTRRLGLASFRILFTTLLEPLLEEMTAVLRREVPEHDAVLAHHFAFPAGLVAEAARKPWASVCLAPSVTPSAEGLPAAFPLAALPGPWGRLFHRLVWAVGRRALIPIVDPPLNRLRKGLGLPAARDHLFSARSARLILHLYSPCFAPKPRDWDERHAVTGFCFDPAPPGPLPPPVEAFLASGPPPSVFTLGTAIVNRPGDFYAHAAASLAGTDRRALLLTGDADPGKLPPTALAWSRLPFGALLPRCAAVVHHGGIGTLAATLRAGRPALCCPVAFDQPNNGARLAALGAGMVLPPRQRTAAGFRRGLERLLAGSMPKRAEALAAALALENGPLQACLKLEERLF